MSLFNCKNTTFSQYTNKILSVCFFSYFCIIVSCCGVPCVAAHYRGGMGNIHPPFYALALHLHSFSIHMYYIYTPQLIHLHHYRIPVAGICYNYPWHLLHFATASYRNCYICRDPFLCYNQRCSITHIEFQRVTKTQTEKRPTFSPYCVLL